MEEIEQLLIKINTLKDGMEYSVDIYYNDLDETFVVKYIDIFDKTKNKHFRNNRLIDSLLDCYNFLKLKNGRGKEMH